jgi:HK97 family phage prohead protease
MTDLLISGYASRFEERDLGADRVHAGAFAASLLIRPAPRPMLYGHDTANPIGVWERIVEDSNGLFVEGRLQAGTEFSDRILSLVRSGAVNGLSIGYRTQRSRASGQGRELLEIDLWEISIVAFPMLPTARIDTLTPTPAQCERIAA